MPALQSVFIIKDLEELVKCLIVSLHFVGSLFLGQSPVPIEAEWVCPRQNLLLLSPFPSLFNNKFILIKK